MSGWIDAHAHPERVDLAEELRLVRSVGVAGFVAIGTDVATSEQAAALVAQVRDDDPDLFVGASVGVHPHEAARTSLVETLTALASLASAHPQHVVAVGECGLDYFYDHSPRSDQHRLFEAQATLATELGLPLVVHSRDAWRDTVAILREVTSVPVIIHSYAYGPAEAEEALEHGWFLSFSGIVTFKNAETVRDALRLVPLGRLLVETDTPFLAPVPVRGRPNHIAHVALTGQFVARELRVDDVELATTTAATTRTLFRLRRRDDPREV